jgi:hypothetical protein
MKTRHWWFGVSALLLLPILVYAQTRTEPFVVTVTPVSSVTYNIVSGGNSIDAGGKPCTAGVPNVGGTNTGVGQQWQLNGAKIASYYMSNTGQCPPSGGQTFMKDNNSGGMVLDATGDAWTLTTSGSGKTIQNQRTLNYLSLVSGALVMSPTVQTVWNFNQSPTPTGVANSPTTCNLQDTNVVGTPCSTTTVTMSDGTQFWGFVTASNSSLFSVPLIPDSAGATSPVTTARAITTADNGATTTITACSGGGCVTSATLTMNVTSGGGTVACVTGGPAPFVPTAANAGGFTTCALYLDFTVAGGYAATTSNYILNCNATIQYPLHNLMIDTRPPGNYVGDWPCNRSIIATSPHGAQTLHLHLTVAELNGPHTMMRLQWPSPANVPEFLGYGNYNEITFELVGRDQSAGGHNPDIFNWWHRNADGNPGREFDDIEIWSAGYSAQSSYSQYFINDGINPPCCPNDGVDWSQTHSWGTLTTIDTSNNIAVCGYLDKVLKNCSTMTGINNEQSIRAINMVLEFGNQGSDTSSFVQDIDTYIHKMQYWACSNWATASCHGPPISSPPNPTN